MPLRNPFVDPGIAMIDLRDSLITIAEDLFNLEINTVVKDTMTARKMPDPANALVDIAQTYAAELQRLGIPIGYAFGTDSPDLGRPLREWPSTPLSFGSLSVSVETFDRLRDASVAAQNELADLLPDDRIVLVRIARNSDQIKNLLSRIKGTLEAGGIYGQTRRHINSTLVTTGSRTAIPLGPDDRTLLRKIWEIGVEKVVMQTVIQLDGDVITRIQSAYTAPDKRHLFDVHERSVDISVRFWGVMANTVAVFLGSFGALLGRRRTPLAALRPGSSHPRGR
ncbi:MAG: hypothetical protein ACFCUO_05915 [Rhodospirillales bacterium]